VYKWNILLIFNAKNPQLSWPCWGSLHSQDDGEGVCCPLQRTPPCYRPASPPASALVLCTSLYTYTAVWRIRLGPSTTSRLYSAYGLQSPATATHSRGLLLLHNQWRHQLWGTGARVSPTLCKFIDTPVASYWRLHNYFTAIGLLRLSWTTGVINFNRAFN